MNGDMIVANRGIIRGEKHFIEHFLQVKSRRSEFTARSYERDIKDFFCVEDVEHISLEQIVSVTIFDVENFMLDMQDKGLSSATINRKISSLSSLYKWLLRFQDNRRDVSLIKFNPFGAMKDEKPKVNNKDTEFLTLEESRKLIESIDTSKLVGKRNKALLTLAITTALRKSEIINIKICHIQKRMGYDVIEVIRKGGQKDIVKLQPGAKKLIDEYIEATGRSHKEYLDKYLFIGHSRNGKNKERLDPSTLNYMIKACCKRAGIDKKLKVHSTRHTAITLAITSGATIEKVRDFAAHKNIATTNRYVHSIDKLKENAGDLIDIF